MSLLDRRRARSYLRRAAALADLLPSGRRRAQEPAAGADESILGALDRRLRVISTPGVSGGPRRRGLRGGGAGFRWPDGSHGAVSFSFDDAEVSAVRLGRAILEARGYRGTYFVLMSRVEREQQAWRDAAAAGHEIGNHTTRHPCSGNFGWSREQALEEYTLEQMAAELDSTSDHIERFFGRRPSSFAYCCGQTFVGRGTGTQSYVQLVAERFVVGRGFLDEFPNDPTYVDLAQVGGVAADGLSAGQLIELAEQARHGGHWLVLAGHHVGTGGRQTVDATALSTFCDWLQEQGTLWVAPVGEVGEYLLRQRSARERAAAPA